MRKENIRNFSIISHIDHGKSTLADRLLEITKTITKEKMQDQFLDMMDIERERGITIKMSPVRMVYHPHRETTQNITPKNAEKELLYKELTYKIRGAVFNVKKNIGLGHKEQIYHNALEIEFKKQGIIFESKKNIPIFYEGKKIGIYQPDFIVENKIIIEIKSLPEIGKPQTEQVWSYLKGCDYKLSLLINFGSKELEIKRIIYDTARFNNSALSASSLRDSAGESNHVENYILNMIDTPGHVDFSYEVSRSLAAVEGVVLLVDATKGAQAQTLANLEFAQKQGLVIIPVINKIDLPNSREQEVAEEIAELVGIESSDVLRISAKNNVNIKNVLDEVIIKIPPPDSKDELPLKALVFDSKYDSFKGVIAQVRIKEGTIKNKEKIHLMAVNSKGESKETGIFVPQPVVVDELKSGEIGYIATGIKEMGIVKVGDTITKSETSNISPLPGYKDLKPVVFISFYPEDTNEFILLKESLEKIKLTDPALSFEPEFKEVLGRGFRCGFLGSLHAEIISERLFREFDLELVISSPSVVFKIFQNDGKELSIMSPSDWPDPSSIKESLEPWVKIELMTPNVYLGRVMDILNELNGRYIDTKYFKSNKILILYDAPLRKIIVGFHDKIKSATQGYASFNYNLTGFEKSDLAKLEILVAEEVQEVFSKIISKDESFFEGRKIVKKLKEFLPPQQFAVPIQAKVYGKIIARENIKSRRKNVTGDLYGGDVTRKRKLLEKQKKGKKKMKEKGKIKVPSDVYFKVFKD